MSPVNKRQHKGNTTGKTGKKKKKRTKKDQGAAARGHTEIVNGVGEQIELLAWKLIAAN